MRPNLNNLSGEKEALSLLELNTRIRGALSRAFPETCWVRAEMSDVRVNTSSGQGIRNDGSDGMCSWWSGTV